MPQVVPRDGRRSIEKVEIEQVVPEEGLVDLGCETGCGQGRLGHITRHHQRRLRFGIAPPFEPVEQLLGDLWVVGIDLQLEPVGSLGPTEPDDARGVRPQRDGLAVARPVGAHLAVVAVPGELPGMEPARRCPEPGGHRLHGLQIGRTAEGMSLHRTHGSALAPAHRLSA